MHVGMAETRIETLRVTSDDDDSLALRLKLTRALSSSALRPHTLPATAILCIRHLRDPLPGTIRVDHGGAHVPPAWQNAMRISLDELIQRAVRPACEQVKPDAEAVIFADRSELLACLTADRCDGAVTNHWWWRSLLAEIRTDTPLPTLWLEAPEYAPAALHQLAAQGKAGAFARALTTGDARTLLQRITRTFGLSELQSALDLALDADSGNAPVAMEPANQSDAPAEAVRQAEILVDTDNAITWASQHRGSTDPIDRLASRSRGPRAAPWERWVPESTETTLPAEQRCLLGIGLMLCRSPSFIRSDAFARAVRQWDSAPISRGMPKPGPTPIDAVARSSASVGASESAAGSQADSRLERSLPELRADPGGPSSEAELASSAEAVPPLLDGSRTASVSTDGAPPLDPTENAAVPSVPAVADDWNLQAVDVFGEAFETQLGGLFYLINLGLFLGLYGDFTTPAQPGIPLCIWDFVVLVGRRLLGDTLSDDPAWAFLAGLAGRRDGEPPGTDFDPPHEWRLPAVWLVPFPEPAIWEWSTEVGRVQVWHPDAFLILDVPHDAGRPERQLFQETLPYRQVADFALWRGPRWMDNNIAPLERWLTWLMPYIRARLNRALGFEAGEDRSDLLCKHRARITATASHLDITLRLADLPVPIRLAGLDRNPGWVPAAGRIITFHFE